MWLGAEGGAGGGEGEGRWTLEVQVLRAPACQLKTLDLCSGLAPAAASHALLLRRWCA